MHGLIILVRLTSSHEYVQFIAPLWRCHKQNNLQQQFTRWFSVYYSYDGPGTHAICVRKLLVAVLLIVMK